MEIRSYTELGAPKVGDGRIIEGYAVVFGQESRVLYDREKQRAFVEVIEKGAITEELLRSSYSNCATKSGDKFDYLKTVYSPLHDKNVLPEQILIDKFYTHYKAPKFRYSNNLNRGFSILSRIYENSLKREMIVDQMSIDYANESCNVSLIET